jgi:drug/metabolite transporter (DMT)-like permease
MPDAKRFTSILLLLLLSLIWGTSFILMKQGLKVFSPGEVGSIRIVAACIFLLPLALFKLNEVKAHQYYKLFISGIMGIFVPAFLFATAQTRMDSSVAGIMNSLTPIIVLLIGVLFFHQRFLRTSLIGILIGLAGTLLLIISRSDGNIEGVNMYAFLVIAACILYAVNLNFVKYKIADLSSLTITSVSIMLIGPLALAYLLACTDVTIKLTTQPGAWKAFGYILLLGALSTAIATVLFNRLVKITTPLFTSSVTYIIPIVAVTWGVLDGEKLVGGHFLGMILIIAGVYLANRK